MKTHAQTKQWECVSSRLPVILTLMQKQLGYHANVDDLKESPLDYTLNYS